MQILFIIMYNKKINKRNIKVHKYKIKNNNSFITIIIK